MNSITPLTDQQKKQANRIARHYGYGRATDVVFGVCDGFVKHVKYGYRKYSTGEYVSNSYRYHFGWKNTYYQNAVTIVMLRRPVDPRGFFSGVLSNFVVGQ